MNINDMVIFEIVDKDGRKRKCVAVVRKLKESECFRLMGVPELDIAAIHGCGISRSAQYKMAGNSIVAGSGTKDSNGNFDGVLFNIFRKLFVEQDNENAQMELF